MGIESKSQVSYDLSKTDVVGIRLAGGFSYPQKYPLQHSTRDTTITIRRLGHQTSQEQNENSR